MAPTPPASPTSLITHTATSEGITRITITRPSARNAVNPAAATALRNAFLAFEADSTQKVCVFSGAGGNFCAGFDLKAVAGGAVDGERQSHRQSKSATSTSSASSPTGIGPVKGRNAAPMGPSRMIISKPVIAAVAGYAVAGGLELSLLADVRVVEEDAVFGVYCRRFGVPLIDGGTVRLQRVVGLGRAMDMILTGRGVGAREAEAMGLANRVVGKGKAVEEAMGMARALVKMPQMCMLADRRSVYYAAFEAKGWEDALAFEFDNAREVLSSESVDGARRFAGGAGRHGKL